MQVPHEQLDLIEPISNDVMELYGIIWINKKGIIDIFIFTIEIKFNILITKKLFY
ncbi:hypothetical protein KKG31_08520 [Patescibacteria group bacterium]|nr:hypothetical protein [Patescibacteria group bacterium]